QRPGPLMWPRGDQMGRGAPLGATAGRTPPNGEGLQHQDGQSPLLASTNPACISYDPAFSFEIAHIVREGLRRMYGSSKEHPTGENIFYYLTLYNEPYPHPADPQQDPEELQQWVLRGLYCYQPRPQAETASAAPHARILASGVAMQWALEAQQLLAEDWGVAAEVWSAPSWTELRREAMACDRWNQLH